MSELQTISKTIKEKVDFINLSQQQLKDGAEELNVHAVRAKTGKIDRAKEDLKELYREYRTTVKDSCLFILVTGSQAEKYVSVSEKDFHCFSVDGDGFYNMLLEPVPEKLYNNELASAVLFEHVTAAFEEKALDIEIIGYPGFFFEGKFKKMLNSKDDALDLIKRAWNEKVGAEVAGLYVIDKVSEKAANSGYAGKYCPIVLYSNDSSLVKELERDIKRAITGRVFVVAAGEVDQSVKEVALTEIKKVDKKSVEDSLVKIKERL